MTRDLMDDQQAVNAVCEIGRKIEKELNAAEVEAYLRSWRPAPGGGHDPEFVRKLQGPDLARGQLPGVLSGDQSKDGGNPEGAKKP